MASKLKLLFLGYFLVIISLFLYSFTQVDLSLTLSEASWWQVVQKFFQQIGYFNRPLSAFFYISIVLLMFGFYIVFLRLAGENRINSKQLWIFILAITGVLTFSYNAFSYDLFNYIFDAKIFTHYNQNPYEHKALDYLGEPMLSFMRWTHRTYPYGPSWLGITIPFSFLGFNLFLPTFFLFKFIASFFYLGTIYFIGKILRLVSKDDETLGIVIFALNPLVLIESLVSSHNDITMMFFAMASVYFILVNKKTVSVITLAVSIGVKYATAILLPAYIYLFAVGRSERSTKIFLNLLFFSMFISLIAVSIRTNFQPWYLMYILPFAGLIPRKSYAVGAGLILSFFALLEYLPFIYQGDWNEPIPQILSVITFVGFILYIVYSGGQILLRKSNNARINK